MTPTEMLVAQGFPVRRFLGNPASSESLPPVTSFAKEVSQPRSRAAVAGMAGNSMNVHVAGIFLIYCTLFVQPAYLLSFEEFLGLHLA